MDQKIANKTWAGTPKSECPVKNLPCKKCKIKGHFSEFCWLKNIQLVQKNGVNKLGEFWRIGSVMKIQLNKSVTKILSYFCWNMMKLMGNKDNKIVTSRATPDRETEA